MSATATTIPRFQRRDEQHLTTKKDVLTDNVSKQGRHVEKKERMAAKRSAMHDRNPEFFTANMVQVWLWIAIAAAHLILFVADLGYLGPFAHYLVVSVLRKSVHFVLVANILLAITTIVVAHVSRGLRRRARDEGRRLLALLFAVFGIAVAALPFVLATVSARADAMAEAAQLGIPISQVSWSAAAIRVAWFGGIVFFLTTMLIFGGDDVDDGCGWTGARTLDSILGIFEWWHHNRAASLRAEALALCNRIDDEASAYERTFGITPRLQVPRIVIEFIHDEYPAVEHWFEAVPAPQTP